MSVPRRRDRADHAAAKVPDGYTPCPDPTCWALIPDGAIDFEADVVECHRGHVVDLADWAQRAETPGGWTHSGLSLTAQGALGEQVVRDQVDLGEFGRVDGWEEAYKCPLDGRTDLGWGIEVKSVSAVARNHCFVVGSRRNRESKIAYMWERGYAGIVGVLVVLDYRSSRASLWVRGWPDRISYFERRGEPFAVRGFVNPFAERRRAA